MQPLYAPESPGKSNRNGPRAQGIRICPGPLSLFFLFSGFKMAAPGRVRT